MKGLVAAALGAHVLITDLQSVVTEMIEPNILRNSAGNSQVSSSWRGAHTIGVRGGTAAAMNLDWTQDISCQSHINNPLESDLLIAADTVWLKSLIVPFATTVASILAPRRINTEELPSGEVSRGPAYCFLAFQERSHPGSETFAGTTELLDALRAANCSVELLPARVIPEHGNAGRIDRPVQEGAVVHVYRVSWLYDTKY